MAHAVFILRVNRMLYSWPAQRSGGNDEIGAGRRSFKLPVW